MSNSNKIFDKKEVEVVERFIKLIDPDNKVFVNTNVSINKNKKLVLQLNNKKNSNDGHDISK